MSQFRIKGIDYPDDSLEHGLGKGSGRGRPVGSKNGQVMPGAAYMKDYKIVGQKAVGDSLTPGAQNTQRTTRTQTGTGRVRTGNARGIETGGRGATQQVRTGTARASTVGTTQRANNATLGKTSSSATSTPASKVEKGKQALASLTGSDTYATPTPQRNRDMSTAELRALDPVGDWPWSNRRVNAAGGLKAREGRQIVYDNPTLSDDYKKQVAKKYGDSDGKSYPKYLENNTAQPAANTKQSNTEQKNKPDAVLEGTNGEWRNQGKDAVTNQSAGGPADRVYVRSDASDMVQRAMNSAAQQAQAKDEITNQSAGLAADRIPVRSDASDMVQRSLNSAQQAPAKNTDTNNADTQKAAETPEQKSFWDNVGGWFSQAGKDIGDTVSGAWNTTSKAVSDAANWVGNQMGPAGDWARTAYNDVSSWVGDRGRDLDAWWNGRDVEVNDNGRWRQGHQTGVGEQIGNAANAAGQWIGNAAGDVGRTVSDAASNAGQAIGNAASSVGQTVGNAVNDAGRAIGDWWNGRDVEVNDNGRWRQGHEAGMRENLGNAANAAGQWIGNAANDVGQAANNAGQALNTWWNGRDVTGSNGQKDHYNGFRENLGEAIGNAANATGQWIGARAQDVGNFVNGPQAGTLEAVPYWDAVSGQYVDPMRQTLGDRIGQAVGNTVTNAGNWLNNNVVAPVNNAANYVRDTANTAQAVSNAGGASNIAGRALSAGVPLDMVNHWNQNYASGQIDEQGYEDLVDRYILNHPTAPVNSSAVAAGQRIGNAVNDVGRTANELWNGRDYTYYDQDFNEYKGHAPGINEIWNGRTIDDARNGAPYRVGGLKDLPAILSGNDPSYVEKADTMSRYDPEYQAYRNGADYWDMRNGNYDRVLRRYNQDLAYPISSLTRYIDDTDRYEQARKLISGNQ